MKVVYVSPFYHPVKGGVESVVKRVAEYMVQNGVETYVVTYNRDRLSKNVFSEKDEVNKVIVMRLPVSFSWSHGSYSPKLKEALRSLKPDIVHVHVWRHPHVFQLAKEKYRKILQPHSPFYLPSQVGVVTYIYYKIIDTFMGSTFKNYKVVSMTPHEQKFLEEKFGVTSYLIPNGIDDKYYNLNSERGDYILYLGRISREKNIMTLIKAYKISGLKDKLVLAGPDNGLARKVIEYSKRYNLNVDYKGEVSEEEKIELLRKCKFLVNPSPYEGFGLTLVEAEAMGKPTVIIGEGGQLYAAPPNIASLKAENNPESLAKVLVTIANDEDIYNKLSKGARDWAENFRWSKILPSYLELYKEILG
ncbi:glycosyltransferase family 4 protein [Stygiolobus caldivivus]|uniref:Glycosyl transferase group 1 n=1 Tax=Stygiolobus caldivivus TaxID=2824673 RepID=A0A8D5ZI17_9CREN|nr:glycosyltransferase family 4 protein [Stygiolobus caldivivus]BCU69060.1 hypothetical protein KN1_03570 [Stygiolobus caldivivus]